jgi:hypothetical protein
MNKTPTDNAHQQKITEGEKDPYRRIARIVNKDVDVKLRRLDLLIIATHPDFYVYKDFPISQRL